MGDVLCVTPILTFVTLSVVGPVKLSPYISAAPLGLAEGLVRPGPRITWGFASGFFLVFHGVLQNRKTSDLV